MDLRKSDYAVERISTARSFLFVPSDRPERFEKAMAAGADMVILDLEDAVAPAAKIAARAAVSAWISPDRPVIIRINAADTVWFDDDLALPDRAGVAAIMLSKSIAGAVLERVASCAIVIALVETARGMLDLAAIAATPGVVRLAFGSIDLASILMPTYPTARSTLFGCRWSLRRGRMACLRPSTGSRETFAMPQSSMPMSAASGLWG